jgi:hypothetical protein
MADWLTSMHMKAEHTLTPTLADEHGNQITYDENGTYTLLVDGEVYTELSPLDVSYYLHTQGHAKSDFQ